MRRSFNGRTLPFQGKDARSIRVRRSIWFHGPMVMTSACHAGDRGSIPRGTAIIFEREVIL